MVREMSGNEEDVNLIGYCGLYCGDCHAYTGKIPDLAQDLRRQLRESKYDKFAEFISTYSFGKDFKHYDECYKVLGAMVKFRCEKGCRAGGGSRLCKIRQCCQKKDIEGCWECPEFEECNELGFLNPVHGDAHIKNLKAIKKKGKEGFVKGKKLWYS